MTTYGVDRSGAAGGSGTAQNPIDTTLVTAKGDLIAGTASGAVDNLAVGANETRLVAASAEATGLKYVADTVNYAVAAKGDLLVGTAADTVAPLTVGANGKVLMAESGQSTGVAWNEVPLPRSYLAGLGLANNSGDATNDVDFAVGAARDSTNTSNLVAATAMTKQLDAAWAAGTGAGGRMSAAAIANTTYHCYVIRKDSDGTCDFGFDTSATAPTMPAGYTYFRRIGSVIRSGAAILAFVQDGDLFQLSSAVADISAADPGTSAVTRTMSVPVGVRVRGLFFWHIQTAGATSRAFLLSDLSTTDQVAAAGIANAAGGMSIAGTTYTAGEVQVMTNTSAQIRSRLDISDANVAVTIGTRGWFDTRGR